MTLPLGGGLKRVRSNVRCAPPQQAERLQTQEVWQNSAIDLTVGRAPTAHPVSNQRTAASADVAPQATVTLQVCLSSVEILTGGNNRLERVFLPDRTDHPSHLHMTPGYSSLRVNNQV